MANVKITELTDIGTPASDDVLEIVDISTNTSKKVQVSALGGGATPTLQEVTTAGNETTDNIIKRIGDWTLQITDDGGGAPGSAPLITMNHDVYGPKGIYVPQGLQLNSVDELAVLSQMEILAERNNYIGFQVQNEDLVNIGNNLFTRLLFPTTSSIDQANISRDFVFPDKPDGFTYTLATTDDVGGATDLAYTPSPTNGIVTSSTGTDATLPLADATDAGLLKPADFTQLSTLATDLANINTDAVDKVTVKLALGISKGQAVYISSANGTNIIVSKASNTSEATSSKTLGLLATTGVTNDIVEVVTSGLLDGLDTSTATVGDPVWLGTSGNLIYGLASKPVAPAHLVYIGVVSRVHATVGEIFVRVQNGFELKEIHDVLITSVADNDILAYESSTSLWENKTASALGLATQTQVDLRTREILQDFTDYTTTGVLTEQIISNQAITANDMKINSWLNFIATLSRTGTTNATVAIYLSTTSNNIAGAVKIGTATITSTQSLPCFKRDYSINASSVLRGILFTANIVTDEIATQAQSTTTLTLGSAYYLITTVQLNNVADTVTQRAINLKSSK
ncbi:hypothetical protein UFOVP530_21 [uncultured Caudovirales phage]|uniref:Uncharacterized protein n=1 Tax=uncultured Caudovirales phage TaxID=2100421 RepID=A0A6J5MRY9_9CAUD|nr:hypothetical protein UFOVP530_21 [uncultured Caudovirales phage]CAB4178939.1 hypothetical protein UFOVP1027_21 [uncultured Caudovirales phage]CAB4188507.1 hypothetical protein UFOVP1182_39 [uncultured Caudovirales phage]CAB4220339.1 hypothetical protein UFOVP1632_3 [uncultured Caudovirales phage]